MTIKELITQYMCPGCMSGQGSDCPMYNYKASAYNCSSAHPGTFMSDAGALFLGFPAGFTRRGPQKDFKPELFESWEAFQKTYGYDKFNIPVWKHLDDQAHGGTG